MRLFIILFALVLIVGCENYPIYEKFTTSKKSFECVSLDVNDTELVAVLNSKYGFKKDNKCDYKLIGYIHNSSKCTSVYSKTHGNEFNGYIYMEIKQKDDTMYRVQSDFKDDINSTIDGIVTKINNVINR